MTLNLFAVNHSNRNASGVHVEFLKEYDSITSKQQKITDVEFAEKLRELKKYYEISTSKDWHRLNPIVDSLHYSFKLYTTTAQRAAYNVFMLEMFNDLSIWNKGQPVGTYHNLPVSQWSNRHITDALKDKISELFAARDELRQLDAKPYLKLFNSEPLNQFDNLYQLLLTTSVEYCNRYYQDDIRDSLFVELDKEIAGNKSLQINKFAQYYNRKISDSIYFIKIEELMAKSLDDNAVVRLIDKRLHYLFNKPSKESRLSSSYYEQLLKECNAAIKRFDESKYINNIELLKRNILTKKGEISTPKQVYPNTPFTMSIVQKNYKQLEVVTHRIDNNTYDNISDLLPYSRYLGDGFTTITPEISKKINKLLSHESDIVLNELFKFDSKLYVEQRREIEMSVKDIGNYLVLCHSGDNKIMSVGMFYASRISPLAMSRNGEFNLYVTDFMSGKPLERVEVDIYDGFNRISDSTYDLTKKLKLDGFTKVIDVSNIRDQIFTAKVISGEDSYTPVIREHFGYYANYDTLDGAIFTDRKRYMQSDTICFRGYIFNPGKNVIPNHKLTYNISHNSGASTSSVRKQVTTDEWGGFNCKFVIPRNWMAGNYTISTYDGFYASITIGDYKLPTIEVQMNADSSEYSFGDSVKINGSVNAYAGFPITSATVKYVVTRYGNSFFRYYSDVEEMDIISSKTTSNYDGKFDFSFLLEPQKGKENEDYTYIINVTITIPTGETQLFEKHIYVGANRYKLSVNAPYDVNSDVGANIIVAAQNIYRDNQDGIKGSYKVISEDREVFSGRFVTGVPILVPWDKLENYNSKFVFNVDKAEELSRSIFIYSASDRVVPIDTALFFKVTNSKFSVNSPLEFVLGSSEEEIYTLVELYDNSKKWYSKLYITKDRMERHTIPYNTEFPNHMKLINTTFYKGKLYRSSDDVQRQIDRQHISLKLKSIRKIALPGSNESLSLEVLDKETGKGVEADIVLSIYDKSSDNPIANIYDTLNDGSRTHVSSVHSENANTGLASISFITHAKTSKDTILFVEFEDEAIFGSNIVTRDATGMVLKNCSVTKVSDMIGAIEKSKESTIEVRDNFSQTALFMGGVRTDSMGVAKINYKLPDAVTTYSIKAFATLKNTASAVASSEFIASKSVMIIPNLPQFFRFGDQVDIRVNAVNITDETIDAKVRMEMFDVNSKQVLNSLEKSISMAPTSSEVIVWSIPAIKTECEIVGMRFIIDSPNHTDAEERIMPIVPAIENLIKGQSYFLNSDKKQIKVNLKSMLVDSASSEVLYVTCGTPSSMLLNTMSNFDVDYKPISVIDYADRLHMYGLGSTLAYTYRKAIGAIANNEQSTSKNEEQYRDVLGISRGETPWDKTVKFTNVDFLKSLLSRKMCLGGIRGCLTNIRSSANRDGGFGWFRGMSSSFAVSAYFLDKYVLLSECSSFNGQTDKGVYANAAIYLDNYIIELYNASLRSSGKPKLNSTIAYYLYIRSGLPLVKFSEEAQKVRDYYLKLVANGDWKELPIMGKAYIAMGLKKMRMGYAHILDDLSKYAVKNETLGYYFPNAVLPMRGSIYCEVSAHTLLLRLFTRNESYDYLANGIMQWLMLQRKNQAWSSNTATLDAIWAISDYYQSLGLANTSEGIIVSSSAKGSKEMSIGGLLDVYKVKNDPNAEVLTVDNRGNNPIFVDILYSYKLPVKQIKRSDNGFNVTRTLYRIIDGEYVKVNDETIFNIGDQVLAKYHIQNSENRSYVRIKALRSGALEPINNRSSYEIGYYREVRKSHNNYFFYLMPEGLTTIDEHFTVWYSGKFNDGFIGAQSLYEPTSNGNTSTYTMEINTSIDI